MIRALATVLGLLALACALPQGAVASERALLQAINAERAAAGIAPLAATQDWNDACAQHATYMAANRILGHGQDPLGTAASSAGAWAGVNSVVARSTLGFASNPWARAPFHQFQLLHPWLSQTGVGVSGDYACMVTLAGRDAANPPGSTIVTVPGSGQTMRASELAREAPFVPAEVVGLPAGEPTGPHLYVYALGPERYERVEVLSASLVRDDSVAVPLRWVDGLNARAGAAVPGGAIVIPTRPLEPGSHTLRVRLRAAPGSGQGAVLMSRTTSFSAGSADAPPATEGAGAGSPSTALSSQRGRTWQTLASRHAPMRVSLSWSRQGARLRLQCLHETRRCKGTVRVLVKRSGGKRQPLRFTQRRRALRVNLAPRRGLVRQVRMSRAQRRSGRARGLAVRWRGGDPVRVSVRRD